MTPVTPSCQRHSPRRLGGRTVQQPQFPGTLRPSAESKSHQAISMQPQDGHAVRPAGVQPCSSKANRAPTKRVDISPREKTPLTKNIAARIRARRLIGHWEREDKRLRELEKELQDVRRALVRLMPTEIADFLLSYHSCESESHYGSWQTAVVERICNLATPEPSQSLIQERAYCPYAVREVRGDTALGSPFLKG